MTDVFRVLIVVAALAYLFWLARRLDLFEASLEWDDVADDEWAPPEFRRARDGHEFRDTLDTIRSLPEVAA